jgi:hypothetical protein
MSKYLARLNALIQEKPLPKEPSKPSKVAFERFEGDQGRRVSGIDNPPEPDEVELEERKTTAGVPEPISMLGRGCKSKSQCEFRMRNGGKPSMTRAGSSTNGEVSRSNSAGRLANCSTFRAMAGRGTHLVHPRRANRSFRPATCADRWRASLRSARDERG